MPSKQRHGQPLPAIALLLMCISLTTAETLEKTWTLYHSLNGGQDFSHRASVVLSVDPETDGSVDMSIINDNSTLNEETFRAAKAEGSMYQLKLVEEGSNDFILSTVPGCQLLRANFREEIVINFGPKASAISLTYIPLVSPLAPKTCDHEVWENKLANNNLPEGWESRISWETATPGMVLRPVYPQYRPQPGLKWLPRLGSNGKLYNAQGPPGTDKEPGKGGGGGTGTAPEMDNSAMGFLRRYWYILLPILIANFMGGEPAAPEGQQPQGGGAIRGGGAPPTAAPAAATKRRGKRG